MKNVLISESIMMIKKTLSAISILVLFSVSAQDLRISGKIIDSLTGEPLSFSHIGIFNTSYGTISNIDGKFSLIIPSNYIDDKLSFSYLGYELKSISISTINYQEDLVVKLKPTVTKLPEAIITIKEESLIEEAIDAIPKNHDQSQMQLKAFWRATIKNESEEYVQMTEYAFDMFRYGQPGEEKNNMKILHGRVARDTSFFADIGGMHIGVKPPTLFRSSLLKEHPILDKKMIKNHLYEIKDVTTYQERAVYVVSFKPNKMKKGESFEGEILLDTESLAFVKITYTKLIDENNPEKVFGALSSASMLVGLGKSTMDQFKNELNYQLIDGKWYLSHAKYDINWTMRKNQNNIVRPVTFKADFVVTEIEKESIVVPPLAELASKEILERQVSKNSDEFWKKFNYLLADDDFEELFQEIIDRK